jgi:adenosylcobinamide-phosphate synthase
MDFVPALALLVALAVDRVWGEPRVRLHPVVWMGNYLGWVGRWVQARTLQDPAQRDLKSFWLAAIAWSAGAAMVLGVAWALQHLLLHWLPVPWWAAALGLGLLLKPLLAWAMLQREALAVEAALGESLQAGRERLRWLVSRDVAELSATEVRESAIETLAENLNDSVVAPIFWFVLLGLPGAALYRFANTADAMWGYPGLYPHDGKGQNWAWAGKWAARADDGLSWLPARITALLLLAVAGAAGWRRAGQLRTEARQTPSPNSGWPMAAMALALGVALRKPDVYVLHASGNPAQAADMGRAAVFGSKALLALVGIALAAMVLVVPWSAS